jgi:hypothetical protein
MVTSSVARADGAADNLPDQVRQIPPPGIPVNEETRARLSDRLDQLTKLIAQIRDRQSAELESLLPDVEVFQRAVDQALRYGEVYEEQQWSWADDLLAEGERRALQLLDTGAGDWTTQTGLVVRGFRSRLDGTVQPYGLVIPAGYSPGGLPMRCDIWFHGRGETSLELQFIHQRMTSIGQIAPENTIVLHPFGRYSNAFKFAGEVDTLEALDHARANYHIDDDRTSVRGFSMGGAGCWQFAVHYPDRWFAANPGAGFSETPEFLKFFQQETLDPPWYEERLWRMYDCPGWVENLARCPVIAYSGEDDIQKQAADIMEEAYANQGMQLLHIIGPETGHSIHPDSLLDIEARMASLAEVGLDRFPETIEFVTYTLAYNRMHWLTVEGLEEHWERGYVHADADAALNELYLDVDGVTALTIDFPSGRSPFSHRRAPTILINGNEFRGPVSLSDGSWKCQLALVDDYWQIGGLPEEGLRKRHGLQGPIDDAFMDPFLFVRPSQPCAHEAIEQWSQSEREHAIAHWRSQMRGDVCEKWDHEVTEEDAANYNLILWGDPAANSVLARLADRLPIDWDQETLNVNDQQHDAAHHAPVLIYPNPENPGRYIVLNSGFTYREYDYLNNARQTPKLPDWAVIDVRTPANSRWPGLVTDAGFFDEEWNYRESEPAESD